MILFLLDLQEMAWEAVCLLGFLLYIAVLQMAAIKITVSITIIIGRHLNDKR